MPSSKSFIKNMGIFSNFLIYAMLEWTIILILYIDGIVTFCSNEIARLFGFNIPCLLCTRFDHILVPRNKNFFFNDSICEEHKKNISSLAYCVMHKKLSNIKTMCEGCLLSFASEKNSDFEKHKHLVGVLDKDIDKFVEENKRKSLYRDESIKFEKVCGFGNCSCCGETIKARPYSTRYGGINSIRSSSFISHSPLASPISRLRKGEDPRSLDVSIIRCTSLKFGSKNEAKTPRDEEREDNKLVPDSEYLYEGRTPISRSSSRLFGLPLSESANTTPRFRMSAYSAPDDQVELIPGPADSYGTMNEGDGDHIINLLKKEVKLDRRSLIELYMELDEERNASAIAANNAMAMITRLQDEKAAVQMEALQYQRMMEEQAEYDQESVQIMKDLVEKKEEEIDELEFELENYRDRFGHINIGDNQHCEVDTGEYEEMKSQSLYSSSEKSHSGSPKESSQMEENENSGGFGTHFTLTLDFEEERSYLLKLLKKLEKSIEPEELPSSSPDKGKHDAEIEQKSTLTREMSTIRERLRGLEAESGFLRHAAMTIRKGSEGTKLLTEIAEHLRKLRKSGSTTQL